jgi:hypothetical protein
MKVIKKWYRHSSDTTQIWQQEDSLGRTRYYIVSTWRDNGQKLLTTKSYVEACLKDGIFIEKNSKTLDN